MTTVSATIQIMDQASKSFQRMTNQVIETTTRMERLKRVVEAPFELKVDASAAETALQQVRSSLGAAPRTMDIMINAQDIMQNLSRIQSAIRSRLSDMAVQVTLDTSRAMAEAVSLKDRLAQYLAGVHPSVAVNLEFENLNTESLNRQLSGLSPTIQIHFNTADILQRAQAIRQQIETNLRDIRANIELEMPAGLRTLFSSLQRMVARLAQSIDQLNNRIRSDSANATQLTAALERIARLERQIVDLQGQNNRQIVGAGKSTRSWWDQLQNVASAYYLIQGALHSVRSLTDVSDSYINTRARLDLINNGLQTTAQLQEQIFQSADRARGSYTDMAAVIGRMGTLAGDAFKSNDELIAFTELMQKSFRVGGSGTMEQQAGMYQLSQAMAAGKLQGDEFRSIMENAPMLAAAIADVTGKTKGQLKEMSADGTITADIIKAAMFNAADDINTKFASMPRTFGDMMNELQNSALQTFGPLIQRINDMLNSPGGAAFIESFKNGIADAAVFADNLLTSLIEVYNFMSSAWPLLAPIIIGIVTALGLYKGAIMAISIWTGITSAAEIVSAGIKAALTGATLAATSATAAQTAAQWGLNAAILASPITWIILGIIALIAIFYLVIAAINKFAGTSLSATGIIVGAFAILGSFIWNTVVGVINAIIQFLWTSFVEPWISIIEWVLNVFNGGFNSFGDAVKNLIGQIISWFLSLGKVVTKIIDAIFGTNWTAGLSSLQDSMLEWGKNEQAITLERAAPMIDSRLEYGKAWDAGYDLGSSFFNGGDDGGAANAAAKNAADSFTKLPPGAATAAKIQAGDKKGKDKKIKAVGEIEKPVDISKEDLKIMRDVAEMKNIQNFVTLTPTIQVKTGPVNNQANVDSIVKKIGAMLTEEVASTAKGVYS
ncbi:tape measure protein [Paenibacillus sp. FSL L8-0470]|uniref:tape measure protein n=1 Tax=Paenibacillus sp. FSL L8-0470 TaxID=2954688 RepID=UPI0030F6DE10